MWPEVHDVRFAAGKTQDSPAALAAPLLDAASLLDHAGLDLEAAHRITYRVEQRFRYTYDAPVTSLSQRLVMVPRSRHGDVHRVCHKVHVLSRRAVHRGHHGFEGDTD